MENKLQELTEKIYAEGIQKAEDEKKEILEKAKKEADDIIKNANAESDKIIEKANTQAEEIRKNVNAEVKLSTNQAISSIKQKISDLVTFKSIDEPVSEAYQDKDFVKSLITTLIKNWSAEGAGSGISLILPENEKIDLGKFLENKQNEILKGGLDLGYDSEITSGFKIGPADGSYKISFTDEDFSNFLKAYLRPRTNQLLYGGE